ncbi:MAG: J domain-containing protein, partial [Polyangiaceae bacterium]|nr:J domain-containing protein [Polyangiaceae bacterium]
MPPGHQRRSDPRVEAFAPSEAPRARAPSRTTSSGSRSAIRAQKPTGTSHVAAKADDGAVRSTRRSTRAPAAPKTKAADDVCELGQDAYANIVAFAGKLDTHDHYALLGLERTVERKAVKRAYFALAAQFHPDRYFKKKLGHARVPLERVFHRITEAHDVLTDRVRREAYDRTLPPSAPAAVEAPPPISRRTSKRPPPKSRVPPRRNTPVASEARASPPKVSAQPAPRPLTMPPTRRRFIRPQRTPSR